MKGCDTGPSKEERLKRASSRRDQRPGAGMVFAEKNDKTRMVFVRNFYREGRDRAKISADMQAYYNKVAAFRGRTVTIRYHRDAVGDNIIDGIE
jgi:hypothetical protein